MKKMERNYHMTSLIKQIKIHDITYITILISFLTGYFEIITLLLITIIIHELGHFTMAYILQKEIEEITIYPFGGITKYKSLLNSSIKEELLILISGPLIQILFLLLITILYKNNLVIENTYILFKKINIILLIFNLLPILPLDGGRGLNIILNVFFSFKSSLLISIYFSFIIILILSSIMYLYSFKILYIFILFLIIKDTIIELNNYKLTFNKFILERINNNFNYKEGKTITNINKLKRNKKHKIIKNNIIYSEKEYLLKYYKVNI